MIANSAHEIPVYYKLNSHSGPGKIGTIKRAELVWTSYMDQLSEIHLICIVQVFDADLESVESGCRGGPRAGLAVVAVSAGVVPEPDGGEDGEDHPEEGGHDAHHHEGDHPAMAQLIEIFKSEALANLRDCMEATAALEAAVPAEPTQCKFDPSRVKLL